MVQSKPLRPEWLPAVALSSALALLMLLWSPPVGDLAAQVFRTELFQQAGLAIWNSSWYGGHYTLTYSVLFPPLAALLGPQVVGGLAVVSSSYLFDRLVRDRWGAEARWATLWFAAGVSPCSPTASSPSRSASPSASARCAPCRPAAAPLALAAAAACALASPVAAAFLAGVVLAGALERGSRASRRRARASPAWRWRSPSSPTSPSPSRATFPFAFSSFVAIPLFCGGALFVIRGLPEERQLRRVLVGYVLAATLIWLVPNAMGGNAVRLGALFGGPVLAAVVLARRPRVAPWFLALALAGGLYWQLTASVNQIARSVGDPSTAADYFEPAAELAARARRRGDADRGAADRQPLGVRLPGAEVRARPRLAAPARHHPRRRLLRPGRADRRHLQRLAAPQRDLLRRPARRPARLLLGHGAPPDPRRARLPEPALPLRRTGGSTQVRGRRSRWWRRWAPAAAQTLWVGRQGFALDVTRPGEFLVRVNFTPYWSIARGAGCILRRGDWTVARASHPGVFRVAADFSLGRAWNAVTGARKTC